jgi:hypothetical protein
VERLRGESNKVPTATLLVMLLKALVIQKIDGIDWSLLMTLVTLLGFQKALRIAGLACGAMTTTSELKTWVELGLLVLTM